MHIEPGIVDGAKIILSYGTAAGAGLMILKVGRDDIFRRGAMSLAVRSGLAATIVLGLFQVLPHPPVGVSEVHLILGSTLFLLFGAAPAAIGLALGLLVQGLVFAPFDLPQYGMNVTTLLVPLFALSYVADRLIAPQTPYVDLGYRQVLALSVTYQAGIVAWVAFWVLYGQGVTMATLQSVSAFGAAYLAVILAEPLIDLGVLAVAKSMRGSLVLERRLHASA
ncbi:cobalt transporter [Tistrella bauzanensis]|uniref:Cobalt transporter n=1 Tax=Tistrella bauzanensis TaxID=657419 RepID=A0ABQ1JA20_9PROT|nr:energy-coupling factor ABC transporter permease [Tistrella bauzanensis]GGB63750.1 cobalt transporter [Tistrella bauzanensis]